MEDITTTYVILRAWDMRRVIVRLQWFVEKPFENWTRQTSHLFGEVFIWMDYAMPVEPSCVELGRLLHADRDWDRRVSHTQVVDATERTKKIRFLVSAGDSITLWHFRYRVLEHMLTFAPQHYPPPQHLARQRAAWADAADPRRSASAAR